MAHASNNSTYTDPVSQSYARALFELAVKHDALDETSRELADLAAMLGQNRDLAGLFAHQTIDANRRGKTIEKLFKGRVSPMTLHFLLVLNRKGRLASLASIAGAFDRMAKEKRGEVDVEVHSARPLSVPQLGAVAQRISAAIGRKALVHQHVDPSLIGGLKVRIGDRLMDGSVAMQLRRLARQLGERGHDQLRAHAGSLLQETTA